MITFVEAVTSGAPASGDALHGPESLAVSPDGRHLYVGSDSEDSVSVFGRDAITGALTFVQTLNPGSIIGFDSQHKAASVAISPDGTHVYLAKSSKDSIAVFSREQATGELTLVETPSDHLPGVDGLGGVRSVTVSPDGAHLYAAAELDDALSVLGRDSTTGALSLVQTLKDGVDGVDGLDKAVSVALSPDGSHVYVAAALDHAVTLFSRDQETGILTFVDTLKDRVGGIDALSGAASVAVSPDGHHVYVVAVNDDALTVFVRDSATGGLTFVEVLTNRLGGIDGLNGARSLAVSPDGSHVYIAALDSNAVTVFSRDETTGGLTFVETIADNAGGGLFRPVAVTVSPDGRFVFAVAPSPRAVTVFRRDETRGSLSVVQVLRDFGHAVDGLNGVFAVATSPDGAHVYTAALLDDAIAFLSVSE